MTEDVSARVMKKISPSVILGGKIDPATVHEPRDLYDLFGIVVGTRARQTVNADWLDFIGEFEAVTTDGTVFRAPRCQVPSVLADSLFAQLVDVHAKDAKARIHFAVRISVAPPPKGKPSAVGYEYRVTPLVESRDSNPLALLRETAYKSHPALASDRKVRAVGPTSR